MKKVVCFSALFLALTMGSIAFAQEISFRAITDIRSFEKDLLRAEIEKGQFKLNNSSPFRDIDIDGIESAYGDQEDIKLFLTMIIKDMCPTCATTSSGSTVRVSYGSSSGGGDNAYVINSSDYDLAGQIERNCKGLLDNHRRRRDGKDILIVDNNDDDDKIALCFDRN